MTEDEIAAKKFAMAAKKDQEAREAREKAERDDEDFDEEEFDKNVSKGRSLPVVLTMPALQATSRQIR